MTSLCCFTLTFSLKAALDSSLAARVRFKNLPFDFFKKLGFLVRHGLVFADGLTFNFAFAACFAFGLAFLLAAFFCSFTFCLFSFAAAALSSLDVQLINSWTLHIFIEEERTANYLEEKHLEM
jgi:hypothetical protein